ncbi:MAG: hypothetical protein ACHREM_17325, partial [Polyangiales bacterium]
VAMLERALAQHDFDFEPEVQLTLADALWILGDDRPRARALAEKARAHYQSVGHRAGEDRATLWLAGRDG